MIGKVLFLSNHRNTVIPAVTTRRVENSFGELLSGITLHTHETEKRFVESSSLSSSSSIF